MSKMEQLYRDILEFAGCTVSNGGYIQVNVGGKASNVIIEGKDLVFPTAEHQRNPAPDTVMFHPLAENEFGNESDVLRRIREMAFLRLNLVTMHLMNDLISVLSSSELHKSLKPEAQDILYQGIKVDKNSRKALVSIVSADKTNLGKMFTSGWIRRGGQIRGQTYSRAGIVAFPLYKKLATNEFLDDKPKGVRVDDPEAIRKLMKFIFPLLETESEYYQGSDSRTAPSFEAFMKMILRLGGDLQTVMDNFQEQLVDASEFSFDTSWGEWVGRLDELRNEIRLIPNQTGVQAPIAPPVAAASTVPVQNGQVNLASAMANMTRQMAPADLAPKNTSGKRSIADLAQVNPALANNTMMQNMQMQQMNGQNALAAMMSGQAVQPNAANALMAMMNQQQANQNNLIQQLGVQGAQQAMALMQQGVSQQDAAMRVLAMKPPVDPAQQMLQQLLAGQQQQQQVQLMQALAQQQPQNLSPVPPGYPNGQQVVINGRNHLQYYLPDGTIQQIPL